MNPFTAPRARTRYAATAVLLVTAAAAPRGQNVAAPPPVRWAPPPLPEGPIFATAGAAGTR